MAFSGNKHRRRLAISTVIGTVLMTTLTITMGTMVVFWASQTFGIYQGSAGIYFNSRAAALKESLAIEDVWFFNSNSASCYPQAAGGSNVCVNVTIRNVGSIEARIVAVYLNGTSKTPLGSGSSLPYTLTVASAKTFMFLYGAPGSGTKTYFIQVATARGSQVNTYWGYP